MPSWQSDQLMSLARHFLEVATIQRKNFVILQGWFVNTGNKWELQTNSPTHQNHLMRNGADQANEIKLLAHPS